MAAFGLLLPPASRPPPRAAPRLRGVPPPDPLCFAPCALPRTGPPSGRSSKGWVGARGVGNACVVHAPQQPPVQHQKGKIFKTWGKRSASGPEGGPLWAKAVGGVGLWAALLSTSPCRPPFVHRVEQAHATHRVRREGLKTVLGLMRRDNFGTTKDNFVLLKDKKSLFFVSSNDTI